MSRIKYIIDSNREIYVFGEISSHAETANKLGLTKDKIHSAGFISFGVDDKHNPCCTCYGESVTLKKKTIVSTDDNKVPFRDTSTYIAMSNLFPESLNNF